MKQIFIDTETTGVHHWRNSIHQISGLIYVDDILVDSFDFNVKPHERAIIEQQALKVSGVTEEQIMDYPSQKEVHNALTLILSKHVRKFDKTDKYFFCAYNAHFDNAFTRAFFTQCNDNYFGSYFWSGNIDVMVLALEHLKYERSKMKDFKLMTVANHLGVEIDESMAHDSLYDVEITKKVYDILLLK